MSDVPIPELTADAVKATEAALQAALENQYFRPAHEKRRIVGWVAKVAEPEKTFEIPESKVLAPEGTFDEVPEELSETTWAALARAQTQDNYSPKRKRWGKAAPLPPVASESSIRDQMEFSKLAIFSSELSTEEKHDLKKAMYKLLLAPEAAATMVAVRALNARGDSPRIEVISLIPATEELETTAPASGGSGAKIVLYQFGKDMLFYSSLHEGKEGRIVVFRCLKDMP